MHQPQTDMTRKKYLAIQARYNQLYNVKRLRSDDVIAQLQEEFFIAASATVLRILSTDIVDMDDK